MFDYQKISSDLVGDLPERTKSIIERRFGLSMDSGNLSTPARTKRESLESIGKDYGITRERVRQIENDGIRRIRRKINKYPQVYRAFEDRIDEFGGLKKEDIFLASLAEKGFLNHVHFLLSIKDSFLRFSENRDFHAFWTKDPSCFEYAKKVVSSFYNILDREKKPLHLKQCDKIISFASDKRAASSLEISKNIYQNQDGLLGLKHWPEVNPRGVKDKAYLSLRKEGVPLHFTSVADLIGKSALSQTVHNELIKDSRFVLVGRGIYALKEWGYESGEVKDVITRTIKKRGKPLSKQEIIREVMKQRIVKENTVVQNLSNRKFFARTPDGKYTVNES